MPFLWLSANFSRDFPDTARDQRMSENKVAGIKSIGIRTDIQINGDSEMSSSRECFIFGLEDSVKKLSSVNTFTSVFELTGEITIGMYAPINVDTQIPHDRDELYVVISGHGLFKCGGREFSFKQGDILHVPAFVPHFFSTFSADSKLWVIFYGPRRLQK